MPWAITPGQTYPYLTAGAGFKPQLATLVFKTEPFTFLPIGQLDAAQYSGAFPPKDRAAKSAAFAMIARAIGATRDIDALREAPIDAFWNSGPRWQGEVTQHASLGKVKAIAPGSPLGEGNVIGPLRLDKPVIVRGAYDSGGRAAGALDARHLLHRWTGQALSRRSSPTIRGPENGCASIRPQSRWSCR